MKLIQLQLHTPFRSLHAGFTINFRNGDQMEGFSPFCLVGRNGVGKSNVMEALAAIFYHLECIYLDTPNALFEAVEGRPNIPCFDSTISFPDAYELTYRTKLTLNQYVSEGQQLVHIIKLPNAKPEIQYRKYSLEREAYKVANRTEARGLLPDLVIGYSSGENEILSLPFFKMRFVNYDEYKYRNSQQFDFNYREPEGRMFYCDAQFSQAVMLVNYLMQEKSVLAPFENELGITSVERFRLVIRRQQPVTMPADFRENKEDEQHTLQPDIEKLIDILKKCATLWHETKEPWMTFSFASMSEEPSTPTLYLDFWINDATRKAFRFYFENKPLMLLRTFQTLFALNLYDISDEDKRELYHGSDLYAVDVAPKLMRHKKVIVIEDLFIKKQGVKESIPLKSLSDGEHQFLHAIGLSILSRQDNVLFLLDEPETHFNPGWRAKFISTLRRCLIGENGDEHFIESEFLITSHSPFIVSDCKPEQVFVFKKVEGGKITCTNPTFNTFGTSVNILTEEIFEKKESISDIALAQLNELKTREVHSLEEIQQIKEESRELGESVEKVLLFRQLILKEEELKRQKDA